MSRFNLLMSHGATGEREVAVLGFAYYPAASVSRMGVSYLQTPSPIGGTPGKIRQEPGTQ